MSAPRRTIARYTARAKAEWALANTASKAEALAHLNAKAEEWADANPHGEFADFSDQFREAAQMVEEGLV